MRCKNCGCKLALFAGGQRAFYHASTRTLKCHCGCVNPELEKIKDIIEKDIKRVEKK